MEDIVNAHVVDPLNIGDMSCAPLRYFDLPGRQKTFVDIARWDESCGADVVLGGGGLLYPDMVPDVRHILRHRKRKAIFWGGGLNTHRVSEDSYPDWMREFDLVGMRDWGHPFEWVPCASAMHHGFDTASVPARDVVIYEHHRLRVRVDGFPRMKNNMPDLDTVLGFLGSAETVITNTYHGAYWSLLLGRRVVIMMPFSSRFFYIRWPVALVTDADWRAGCAAAKAFPEALEQSRAANRRFYGKVLNLLS